MYVPRYVLRVALAPVNDWAINYALCAAAMLVAVAVIGLPKLDGDLRGVHRVRFLMALVVMAVFWPATLAIIVRDVMWGPPRR